MDIRSFYGKKAPAKKTVRKGRITVPASALRHPVARAAVRTIVKREIARSQENKRIGWQVETNVNHNSAIGAADCVPIVQAISAGTTAQQRVGDRVKPKSLTVRGVVSYTPDTCTTSQNIYVRVMILAQKDLKVASQILAGGVDSAHLLRPGYVGADQRAFTGLTQNLNEPINTDLFRVYYDKTFKLAPSLVTGGGREQQPLYSARWMCRLAKSKLPASLTYDDGNGDFANNFAPFMALGYAFSDGTTDLPTFTRLVSNTNAILDYEDA